MTTSKYLQEESFIDCYLASHTVAVDYPYRIQSMNETSPTIHDNSDKHILDSAINDDTTNEGLIDVAEYYGMDTVVPCDVIGDNDATIDSMLSFFEADPDRMVVIPIQEGDSFYSSAVNTVNTIEDHGYSHRVFTYAVGGIKDEAFGKQRDAVETVRDAIGPERDLHLFGAGMTRDWVTYLRNNQDKIDSLDMSSPQYSAISGRYKDFSLQDVDIGTPRGKHSTRPVARMVESMMTNFNYLLSNGPDGDEVESLLSG